MVDWQQIKDVIEAWTGLERDALHIYAALLVQVAAALVLRRTLAHWLPWLAVLLLAVANEISDALDDRLVEAWEIQAGLHDLWNTMLLPSLVMLLVRFAPFLTAAPPSDQNPG
jgi:uncharacterized membrane-anchored protein